MEQSLSYKYDTLVEKCNLIQILIKHLKNKICNCQVLTNTFMAPVLKNAILQTVFPWKIKNTYNENKILLNR